MKNTIMLLLLLYLAKGINRWVLGALLRSGSTLGNFALLRLQRLYI